LLLITIIIGLISFSNLKLNDLESFTDLDTANNIMLNNTTINRLLNQLQNVNPNVQLINYDPNEVYQDYQKNVSSNINIINSQLSSLYNSNISVNNSKLTQLENTVTDLENLITNLGLNALNNKKYNTIKSLNNGMEMKLVSTPNTAFKDYKTNSNINGYMVMANNGCLSVGATDYDIYKCNDTNPKQVFKMEHILNETAYQNNIDTSLPVDNINKSNINYPFVMMKSINNENCLTNNHGTLTVQPCYSFVAQRWFPL
jgi:hemerythrin superfamily protein